MEFKLRLTDFSGMLLDNKLKPLSIVGVPKLIFVSSHHT